MRPTSTGDECEMNIQPPKAVRFIERRHQPKKHNGKINKHQKKPRDRQKKERQTRVNRKKSLLLCFAPFANFPYRATVFFAIGIEMQSGESSVTTIEVIEVNLTFHRS